jgi:hypothetical protein
MRQQAELDAALKELVRLRQAEDAGNDWEWQDTPEDIAKAMLRQTPKKARRVGAAILTLSKATAKKSGSVVHVAQRELCKMPASRLMARAYDGSLDQRRCTHNQHSGCSRIHRSSVAFIARLSAYTSAARSLVSGNAIGGSQITRNRAGPRRTG